METRLPDWYGQLDNRSQAILIGVTVGLVGAALGLLVALAGPLIAFGAILGVLAGLYILADVNAALIGFVATLILLPFGTLPFKVVITPTLLDMTAAAFLMVYLLQWMTGQRQRLQLTPVHILIAIYALWLILSFALGMRHAAPTPNKLRQFAETLLAISMTFVLVDLIRSPAALRRLLLAIILLVGIESAIAIVLYALPDALSERTLIRLARIGYPDGGVIRYIEDNPDLPERAIGTWVDPNLLGGTLAVGVTLIGSQIFASRPVLRRRWLTMLIFGVSALALFLTFSRASILGMGAALFFIGVMRYRRYLPLLFLGALLLLLLPQSQVVVERFVQAFTGTDLATQMRIGEYSDSIDLIRQYPIFGVGFTGSPRIDVYPDVASMYLIIANQIGLVGLALYVSMILGIFAYGMRSWRYARLDPQLDAIHLGFHAALLALVVNGVADMYFFRLDFQASINILWLVIALSLSSAHLALQNQPLPNPSPSVKMLASTQ